MLTTPNNHSGLMVHAAAPLHAEPPLARLSAAFLTAQSDFFIRCHGEIPRIDAATHRITVRGRAGHPHSFTLGELRSRFANRDVTAALQCAGNRRAEFQAVAPVSGVPWGAGAIGNAVWTGVPLASVLRATVPRESRAEPRDGLHVAFAAADTCERNGKHFTYGVSIPLAKAMTEDVLLAWAMNGEALAPEHGYPLRVVVPGYAGVRSAKWLSAIAVQDEPCDSPIQSADYRLLPPDRMRRPTDPPHGLVVNDMPVNSAICAPEAHAVLPHGPTEVSGYAVAMVRRIARVDVSADDGRTWHQAETRADPSLPWSWTPWRTMLDLPSGQHILAVRAWDEAGQTQPNRPEETWNPAGYLCTAWHRVPVSVT